MTSYTANLAAFLTQEVTYADWGRAKWAQQEGHKVCAYRALEANILAEGLELKALELDELSEVKHLTEAYADGKCQALLIAKAAVRLNAPTHESIGIAEWLCKNNLQALDEIPFLQMCLQPTLAGPPRDPCPHVKDRPLWGIDMYMHVMLAPPPPELNAGPGGLGLMACRPVAWPVKAEFAAGLSHEIEKLILTGCAPSMCVAQGGTVILHCHRVTFYTAIELHGNLAIIAVIFGRRTPYYHGL
jgi:hypothetical protein